MVPVGDRPIVWHIMKYYASFGFRKFVLCLGYKAEIFVDYFLNYRSRHSDVTINLADEKNVRFHNTHDEKDWEVTLANTGLESATAYRLYKVAPYLTEDHFMLTYGDGLSSIDLKKLLSFHLEHRKLVTISAVHPSSRFGEMDLKGNQVTAFNEKRQTHEGFINGGFMVLKREFIDRYLQEDPTISLEQEPLMKASTEGNALAYLHQGFWQCMDTTREHILLNDLWASGKAPWKRW